MFDPNIFKLSKKIPKSKFTIIQGYTKNIEGFTSAIPTIVLKLIVYYLYFGSILKFYTQQFISVYPNLLSQCNILKQIVAFNQQYEFDKESIKDCFDSQFIHHLVDTLDSKHYQGIPPNHFYIQEVLKTLIIVQKYTNSSILSQHQQQWLWTIAFHYHYHIETITNILYLWARMSTDTSTRSYFLEKHKEQALSHGYTPHWLFSLIISNVTTPNQIINGAEDIILGISFLLHQLAVYHRYFRGPTVHQQLLEIIPLMIDFVLDKIHKNKCSLIILNTTKLLLTIVSHQQDINYYYEELNDSSNSDPSHTLSNHNNKNFTFCTEIFIKLDEKQILKPFIEKTLNSDNAAIQMHVFNLINCISVIHPHWRLQYSVDLLLSCNYIDIITQRIRKNQNMPFPDTKLLCQWAQFIKSSQEARKITRNSIALSIISAHLICKHHPNVNNALGCIKQMVKNPTFTFDLLSWNEGTMIDMICDEAKLLNVSNPNKFKIVLIFMYLARLIKRNQLNQHLLKFLQQKFKTNNILNILEKFDIVYSNKPIKSHIKLYESEIPDACVYIERLIVFCR